MRLQAVLDASEELIRLVGALAPTPRLGAAALALALGRVCSMRGIDLNAVFALVRLARDGDDIQKVLFHVPPEEEWMPLRRPRDRC